MALASISSRCADQRLKQGRRSYKCSNRAIGSPGQHPRSWTRKVSITRTTSTDAVSDVASAAIGTVSNPRTGRNARLTMPEARTRTSFRSGLVQRSSVKMVGIGCDCAAVPQIWTVASAPLTPLRKRKSSADTCQVHRQCSPLETAGSPSAAASTALSDAHSG